MTLHGSYRKGGTRMNDLKSLFFSLLNAQTEEDVHAIVERHPVTKNAKNWVPYGGTMGNYSSFENQMTSSEASLIEKLTNSIDSILTRQALKKGIDPSSKKAPKSMEQAVETLFTDEEREKENVLVVVDGERTEPNIIIVDDGEGQEPDRFPDTFLSLQNGNKNNIKFVQGQFNMGSTGAVVFCGKHKYQLIASKRNDALNPGDHSMGFTLVRKHVRTKKERETLKNTWYEYFTVEGSIPRFDADPFDIIKGQELPFTHGAIVKMYNYQLTKKSTAFQQLRQSIDTLLYYPAFPIRVFEGRDYKRSNTSNFAYGNGNILKGYKKTTIEDALEYESVNNHMHHPLFGDITIDLFLFKEEEKEKASMFSGKKPIVFLMNGQVQYGLSTSFISKELNLKLIKNHLIVSIDCTKMKREFLDEGFFQANRESIRDNEQTRAFLKIITDYLAEDQNLVHFNKKRASSRISSQATKHLFERLLGKNQKDHFLKNLFKANHLGSNTRYNQHVDKREKNRTEQNWFTFPTYFNLSNVKQNEQQEYTKALPLGGKTKLKFETDVEPNYFRRSTHAGSLSLLISKVNEGDIVDGDGGREQLGGDSALAADITEQFHYSTNLTDGELSISLDAKETELSVGDQLKVDINITDPQGNEFTHVVFIEMEEPAVANPPKTKPKRQSIQLPSLVQVFKDEEEIGKQERTEEERAEFETWASMDWDEETGADKLVQLAPGVDGGIATIFVNMSSGILKQLIAEEGTTGTKIAFCQEQFLTTIYKQSFLIGQGLINLDQQGQDDTLRIEDPEETTERLVKDIAYASVKMTMNTISSYARE